MGILVVNKQLTKIGEQTPYFSITADYYEHRKGLRRSNEDVKEFNGKLYAITMCGCLHDEILAKYPKYAPLVALHLSDINGVPSAALENGFYFYQIMNGTAKYHKAEAGDKEKYYSVFKKHLRLSDEEAQNLINTLDGLENDQARKIKLGAYIETLLPRWKQEAEEAIKTFDLKISTK